jgi:N-acetylglutamate synthase-like GNAT family acetyltransferase
MAAMSARGVQIRRADVAELLALRHAILRAGLPAESAKFEGDLEPTAIHLAAELDGKIVGCCTLIQRPFESEPAWQLRGMAVDGRIQRTGVGGALLSEVDRLIRPANPSRLWCNARVPASDFYRRHGWIEVGTVFDIPTAGPHIRMMRRWV